LSWDGVNVATADEKWTFKAQYFYEAFNFQFDAHYMTVFFNYKFDPESVGK
jgi:hypothetical protein